MDFLLWIALIGVIVFLLGLIYSKLTAAKTKQPAASVIPPATAVTVTNKEPEKKAAPLAAQTDTAKEADVVQSAIKKPVVTENTKPVPKIIPAAEPVGPAHSPAIQFEPDAASAPAAEAAATTDTPLPPASEPERLKKPRQNKADDLTRITGIGNAIQTKLHNAGIFHYDQFTGLNEQQILWLNHITGFAGRAERENWIAQARKLMNKSAAPEEAPKRTVKKAVKSASAKPKAKAAKTTEKA